MSLTRITQMSRVRFRELCAAWLDGSLMQKWEGKEHGVTKAEQVEERQIKAIGLIMADKDQATLKLLMSDDWLEMHVLVDDKTQKMHIQILGRPKH